MKRTLDAYFGKSTGPAPIPVEQLKSFAFDFSLKKANEELRVLLALDKKRAVGSGRHPRALTDAETLENKIKSAYRAAQASKGDSVYSVGKDGKYVATLSPMKEFFDEFVARDDERAAVEAGTAWAAQQKREAQQAARAAESAASSSSADAEDLAAQHEEQRMEHARRGKLLQAIIRAYCHVGWTRDGLPCGSFVNGPQLIDRVGVSLFHKLSWSAAGRYLQLERDGYLATPQTHMWKRKPDLARLIDMYVSGSDEDLKKRIAAREPTGRPAIFTDDLLVRLKEQAMEDRNLPGFGPNTVRALAMDIYFKERRRLAALAQGVADALASTAAAAAQAAAEAATSSAGSSSSAGAAPEVAIDGGGMPAEASDSEEELQVVGVASSSSSSSATTLVDDGELSGVDFCLPVLV